MSLFSNSAKTIQVKAALSAAVLFIALSAEARDNQTFPKTESLNKTRPLNFEANQGQAAAGVRFLLRGSRYTLLLSECNATLLFPQRSRSGQFVAASEENAPPSSLQMKFIGAGTSDAITGDNALPGKINYLIGNNSERWHRSVPTFAKVHYQNLYKGIDLTFYGKQQQLEYDFIVAPHADIRAIRLSFSATPQVLSMNLEKNGDLLCQLPNRDFRLHKPVFYQQAKDSSTPNKREPVDGRFVKLPAGEIGFAADAYDHTRPLIIDPVISYSTYLGGSEDEGIFAIQRDTAGNLYVTGEVTSPDFPLAGPVQSNVGGDYDGFVSKFDPSGTQLIYSTYLGGSKYENCNSLALDSDGSAYVAGRTASPDFPTFQAVQPSFGGVSDGFVARLAPSGQLIFSTYLGGGNYDTAAGIALGPNNVIYVAGGSRSANFPVTDGAYQTTCDKRINTNVCTGDGFISKLGSTGSTLIYSTYLGGSSSDSISGIAVDPQGTIYISGTTASSDFPVFRSYQARRTGLQDAFLTRLSPDGKSLIFSTYFGGSQSSTSSGLALDRFHNSYMIGTTTSSDLPTVSPFQSQPGGGSNDGFIAKFDAKGYVVHASYLGGSKFDFPFRVAVDSSGSAAVIGFTQSSDFPIVNAPQPDFAGGNLDVFVTKVSPDGSELVYSTYLGGTGDDYGYAVYSDAAGNVWAGGSATSQDFPTTVNAFQGSYAGGPFDAFLTKISVDPVQ